MNNLKPAYKIIVAEDDPGVNLLICKTIERSGHEAMKAYNGVEVLKILEEKKADLLLLDYKMPGMGGKELIENLNERNLMLPFIVMTGYSDVNMAIEMMKLGARDYIVKDQEFNRVFPTKIEKTLQQIATENQLKDSQKALLLSEEKSQRILEAMKDPVYICNSDYEIEYVNPTFLSLWKSTKLGDKCYKAIYRRNAPCEHCRKFGLLESSDSSILIDNAIPGKIFQLSFGPINFVQNITSRLNIFRDITELAKTKEIAEKNELKYRLMAENSINMIWQTDLKLNFTYISPSCQRITEYAPEEIVNKNVRIFTSGKYYFRIARNALSAIKVFKRDDYISFESTVISKSNQEVPIEITGKLLYDSNNKIIGLQGSAKEISERLEAQAQLKSQHNLMMTLINNMPDQIYIKDTESKYLLNNKAHRFELGVNDNVDLKNKSDFDFFDKEEASNFFVDEQKIIDSGIPLINKEEFKVFKNGKSSWSLTTKVPIKDANGKIMGIAGINRDITHRKEYEQEIVRSRYLLSIKNKIANLFLITDNETLFIKVLTALLNELDSNSGFIGYLNENEGIERAAVKGELENYPFLPEKNEEITPEKWTNPLLQTLTSKKPYVENEIKEGSFDKCSLTNVLAVPIMTSEQKLVGLLVIANKKGNYTNIDIEFLEGLSTYIAPIMLAKLNEERMKFQKECTYTELLAAKEKAVEADRLKSAFLLNLSHELRTPLNSIMGFSNLLVQKFKGDEKTLGYAELINRSGQDLIKMVEDTIEIARLENNEITPELKNFDLVNFLNEIYKEVSVYYENRFPELNFTLNCPTDPIILNSDRQKLRKILWKVLDNAGKYTDAGNVELKCSQDSDNEISIQITDTGIGIPRELNEAVFEKFRKIDSKDKIYGGNGLGLSISKGLASLLGGTITLDSDTGKGTIVKLSFPINPETNNI